MQVSFLDIKLPAINGKAVMPEPDGYSYNSSKVRGGVFVGAHYYFTDNFGVFAELGYMLTVFNIGATFKF